MKLYERFNMNGYGTKPSQLKDSIDYAARRFTNKSPINYYTLYVGFIKDAFDLNYEKAYTIQTTFDNVKILWVSKEMYRDDTNRIDTIQ